LTPPGIVADDGRVRLGIDFGTTRTLVACVDRGNFPVVVFIDEDGEAHDHIPSVAAEVDGRVVYGHAAVAAERAGAPSLRSFKRLLAAPDVTGHVPVTIGTVTLPLLDLLTGFLSSVREALSTSNAPRKKGDTSLDAIVAVPAHAHGAQRYLTLEAFSRAGFTVTAMLHEPSAAGFEYTHRQPKTVTSKRTRVVVYDLGGGTFDASLVRVDAAHHAVLGTVGDNRLGGDDFDEALLGCVLEKLGPAASSLSSTARRLLLDRCRDAKERLTAQAKRLSIDVDELGLPAGAPASVEIGVDAFTAVAAPLVQRSIAAMAGLMQSIDGDDALAEVAGVYLVGGATGLPLVPRLLKERFGRRVHRSPHPAASVAIGLAIAASDELGYSLADRFSRCFGVFREKDGGRALRFDPIFVPSTTLPRHGEAIEVVRRYRAAHNVGHFRYLECSGLNEAAEPTGDVVPFGGVVVAFDPSLRGRNDLERIPVKRTPPGPEIEERYVIDGNGVVTVHITDVAVGVASKIVLGC
jgi:molecular chaperone DnaK (HSP70)